MSEFEREPRYVVLKIKDIHAYLGREGMRTLQEIGETIAARRAIDGKPPFNAVVVEQDWPEFDIVWQMIEARMTMPPAVSAPDFLRRAADIMEERGKQYDKPEGERSMGKCVAAFNIVTGRDITEAEGWLLLQILKDVRQWQRPGFHQDSADDCIAYAALKAEAKQKEAHCNGR